MVFQGSFGREEPAVKSPGLDDGVLCGSSECQAVMLRPCETVKRRGNAVSGR